MPYLVDGNNLIGLVRRTARPSAGDRDALVAELADRLRATRARAILFFDGPAGGRGAHLGPLSIRAASPGGADDAIVAEVSRARAPSDCVVVTADRGLAGRVRDAGGSVVTPDAFFAKFGRSTRSAGSATAAPAGRSESPPVDIDEWMRWFDDPSNRDGGRGPGGVR